MKNKILYFIAVLFTTCTCFSCSDSDDDDHSTELLGTWNYEISHFVLNYSEDKLQLPDGMTLANLVPGLSDGAAAIIGKLNAIPIDQLTGLVIGQLHGQMAKYFQGIEFKTETELNLFIKVEGQAVTIPATYTVQKNIILITIDKNMISATGLDIPTQIKLNYTFKQGKLILYLDKTTIQSMLTPEILAEILPDKISISYVNDVLNKTNTLEIGVILKQ